VPRDPIVGSVLLINYEARDARVKPRVLLGKTEVAVLTHRPFAVVAQLPSGVSAGHAKLRLATSDERSKAYELHIKEINWRKPFRNFCGGLALLILGIQALSHGARSLLGLSTVERVATFTRSRLAALGSGALVGAFMQSTTAVAGLLSGLVSSRVLQELPAAQLFLGAQLGAAFVPVAVASTAEPGWGLPAIAIGTLTLGFAPDRRARALSRLVLGAGLVAFGVQVLRPGFEPFISNPLLLDALARLEAQGFAGRLGTALLGALLAALFQGPAPVLILALGIAELTGHSSQQATLALLSGSGLGAGLAALLTATRAPGARRLAQLNLITGACSSLFAVSTLDVFSRLSNSLTAGHERAIWNGKHQLPDMSWQVIVAFFAAQLLATLALFPLLPRLVSWLERRAQLRGGQARRVARPADAAHTSNTAPRMRSSGEQDPASEEVSEGLSHSLSAQQVALPDILTLALDGLRGAGRSAEHRLLESRQVLQRLFSGPVLALPATVFGNDLGRIAVACSQLQRSLESLLDQAERLTDNRLLWSEPNAPVPPLSEHDRSVLREMHGLIADGLASLLSHLSAHTTPDTDETRAREIQLNATESRSRRLLLSESSAFSQIQRNLGVIELIDTYEAVGNQLYRLAETLSEAREATPLRHSATATLEPSIASEIDPV